jgi:hypothetical protein
MISRRQFMKVSIGTVAVRYLAMRVIPLGLLCTTI